MQTRQVSPGAADAVEGSPLACLEPFGARQLAAGDLLRLRQRVLRHVLQPKAAQRQGDALADVAVADVDQFEAATAEIAGDAVRPVEARHDAERRIIGLLAAGEHANPGFKDLLGTVNEIRSVLRLAGGGRGEHVKLFRAGLL